MKSFYFSSLDKNKNEFNISQCKQYSVGYHIYSIPNEYLYSVQINKGVDIYNPKDPTFVEPCFVSKNFDFDLTQKYRKSIIFGNKTFIAEGCEYQIFNYAQLMVFFNCPQGTSIPLNYSIIDYFLEKEDQDFDKVENLAIKCAGKVNNFVSNYAFWLFLMLLLAVIIFDIVFSILIKMKVIQDKILEKEEITNDCEKNNVNTEERSINVKFPQFASPKEVKITLKTKTFCETFLSNLKELHPILSLVYNSFLTPVLFTSGIFIFNIFNIFGFNAVYFTEKQVEDRIYATNREKFIYPMSKEYLKIIYSIITSIGLIVVVRAISLVTLFQKENVIKEYAKAVDKIKIIQDFSKSQLMKRVIAGIIMIGLSTFLFYYSTVFCGMYIHTQSGWFNSGVWSLLIVWVVLSNFYIFVITVIETIGCVKCSYYMKRLFFF